MTKWRLILVTSLIITLAGCALPQCPTMPVAPTKPTLQTTAHPDDPNGRCLDSDNLGQLLLYIHRLEDGYR